MNRFLQQLPRLSAFIDKSGWLLAAVGAIVVGISDLSLLLTLLQWTAFSMVMAGVVIVISRVMFPQIKLTEFVEEAKKGNVAASIVVFSVVSFCAVMFIGIVLWSK